MFDNVSSVSIYDSTFVSSDVIHHHTHNNNNGPAPLDVLKQHIVLGARHDSSERYDPPKCLPETRVALQESIISWVEAKSSDKSPILWLHGAAGAGKSAIAQTLSERWSSEDLLAASFHFSRNAAGRNHSKYLVTTIAYQVAHAIPETRRYIENVIQSDWRWDDRPVKEQVLALLVRPLISPCTSLIPTKVVVIDGLDECCLPLVDQDYEAQQRDILDALSLLVEYDVPLKILITSRPERQIRSSFGQEPLRHAVQIKLNDSWNPDKDIELFLRCTFAIIRRERGIDESWPSTEVIRDLVAKSSGQFIFAAVVMRYLSNPRDDPQARLEVILGLNVPKDLSHNPFAQLDILYVFIMMSIQRDSLLTVKRVFEIMTSSDLFDRSSPIEGSTLNSSAFLSKLLFMKDPQLRLHLIDLHSILDIPNTSHAADQPIIFIHASFSEFLTNPSRSGVYHIDPVQAHLNCAKCIAKHTILAMSQDPDAREYTLVGLLWVLIRCLKADRCPPSRELRMCIHTLIGGKRNSYKQYLDALQLSNVVRTRSVRSEFSWEEQLVVLTYLQRCNNSDIEESPRRRWLMGASLVGQKVRIWSIIIFLAVLAGIGELLLAIGRMLGSIWSGIKYILFGVTGLMEACGAPGLIFWTIYIGLCVGPLVFCIRNPGQCHPLEH